MSLRRGVSTEAPKSTSEKTFKQAWLSDKGVSPSCVQSSVALVIATRTVSSTDFDSTRLRATGGGACYPGVCLQYIFPVVGSARMGHIDTSYC